MENIALAFSGGGFRAAAFSLGCLSYLNKIHYNGNPLLHNVKFISSTSGGSITNLLYSAYIYEGKTFDDFYAELTKQLDGEELLQNALNNLKKPAAAWKGRVEKNINLINAFSLEYDKLLKQREFSLFCDRKNNPHLEEICINSTEFTNGYAFRFQSQDTALGSGNGLIGNNNIFFSAAGIEAAKKIKLADILASSSCFPSGFEPMIFPHDYTTGTLSKQELINGLSFKANNFTLPSNNYNNMDFFEDENFKRELQFGIMDGGVADNQAIDAFMLADNRRIKSNRPKFDIFISCDVTSYFMDGYTLPVQEKKWYDFISFNMAKIIVLTIISLIALWLPFSLWYFNGNWQWWNSISAAIAAVFFIPAVYWFINKLFKSKSSKAESSWGLVFKKYMGIFTGMSLGRLKQLLITRAKSVFILANDVYLKQIRRIYYDRLYSDPNYKGRIIQNAIYDLSRAKFSATDISTEPLHPSAAMIEIAEKARTMGTTLWFDANHQNENIKNCIMATGQFTTCYNLLKHIGKMDTVQKTPAIVQLEEELSADYTAFLIKPI
jgi:predicted acylesterase/phospholipase RssA